MPHVAETHVPLTHLWSKGRGAWRKLLLPSSPPPPSPHAAKEQRSQELGAHLMPLSALPVYSAQKGSTMLNYRPAGLLGGLPSLAASLSTKIVYIRSGFASDSRDLFLIATTQG